MRKWLPIMATHGTFNFCVFRTFRNHFSNKMHLILVAKIITEMAKKCENGCQLWQRTERANFRVFRTFRNHFRDKIKTKNHESISNRCQGFCR